QGGRALSGLALGTRGAVPRRLARAEPRALPRIAAGPQGHAGSLRQERVRQRRGLVPLPGALPPRRAGPGAARPRAVRAPLGRRRRRRPPDALLARAHPAEAGAHRGGAHPLPRERAPLAPRLLRLARPPALAGG